MDNIIANSIQIVEQTSLDFKRYIWKQIDWSNRLIIVTGARGVGKTTLLLQYIKEQLKNSDDTLYLSIDELFYLNINIIELAEEFTKRGGKHLILDEIHKSPNWSREIKIIYDRFKDLNIIITGSSTIEILKGQGDLSRRAIVYQMQGLSFREYIDFEYQIKFPAINLNSLIKQNRDLALSINKKIKPIKLFEEYLKFGYYPFYKENKISYHKRLQQITSLILETDIPSSFNIDYNAVVRMKKLIGIIANIVPFKPNIKELSEKIGVSRETLIKYLQYLEKASIIQLSYSQAKGITALNKPEKIYLNNPNLIYSLGKDVNIGNLRETFFLNQLKLAHEVAIPKKGDFIIDNHFTFEIGGKDKNFSQIKTIANSYIAADNIEIGTTQKIPLWLFGFLY